MNIPCEAKNSATVVQSIIVDDVINSGPITLGHVNRRSIQNKGPIVEDFLDSISCDILETEIHIKPIDTPAFINELTPPDYTFDDIPHMHAPGGGVGILAKNTLRVKQEKAIPAETFEHIIVSVLAPSRMSNISVLYRPPGSSLLLFLDEFMGLVNYLSTLKSDCHCQ